MEWGSWVLCTLSYASCCRTPLYIAQEVHFTQWHFILTNFMFCTTTFFTFDFNTMSQRGRGPLFTFGPWLQRTMAWDTGPCRSSGQRVYGKLLCALDDSGWHFIGSDTHRSRLQFFSVSLDGWVTAAPTCRLYYSPSAASGGDEHSLRRQRVCRARLLVHLL